MPIRNEIKKLNNGVVGVIDWKGTPEEFIKKLKNVESSIVKKISNDKLLLSVDFEDFDIVNKYNFTKYTPHEDEIKFTSILIKRKLTPVEEEYICSIINILIKNGSIKSSSGINIRFNRNNKSFINFYHNSEYDRSVVKAFIKHLCV